MNVEEFLSIGNGAMFCVVVVAAALILEFAVYYLIKVLFNPIDKLSKGKFSKFCKENGFIN